MVRRLAAAAALVAVATAPAASAVGCLPGFVQRPTGLYNPTTGKPIEVCVPYWEASA
jgi:hypothetical protein